MRPRSRRVLLLYIPYLRPPGAYGSPRPIKFPLLSLFCHLKSRGVEVDVLDLELELGRPATPEESDRLLSRAEALLAEKDFDLAAVSCYTSYEYAVATKLAVACRRARPEAWIATGGWHPSAVPGDFMGPGSPFDFVITGEGELALERLASEELPKPGTGTRVVAGRPLELRDDAALPFEDYPYASRAGASVCLVLSRGCPFQCAYCMEPMAGGGWRAYSVAKSLEIVERAVTAYRPGLVVIQDPIFGFQKSWRREFLRGLIERKLPVDFSLQCRVDILDSEDVALLGRLEASTWLGVETASPRMMSAMRKTENPALYLAKIADVLSEAARKDALFGVNLIENHPGETPESNRESHAFFSRLAARLPKATFCAFGHLYAFYPGTPVYEDIGHYERAYGTRVENKRWWACESDIPAAWAVVASSQTEAAFGRDTDYWRRDFEALEAGLLSKASPKMRLWLAQRAREVTA